MFRTKIGGGLGEGCIQKKLGTLLISSTVEARQLQILCTTWVWDYLTKKQRLGPKLAVGAWARGEFEKKFGTPYLFLQLLKLATEKLVHNMSSGLPCQTSLFR